MACPEWAYRYRGFWPNWGWGEITMRRNAAFMKDTLTALDCPRWWSLDRERSHCSSVWISVLGDDRTGNWKATDRIKEMWAWDQDTRSDTYALTHVSMQIQSKASIKPHMQVSVVKTARRRERDKEEREMGRTSAVLHNVCVCAWVSHSWVHIVSTVKILTGSWKEL